MSDIVTSTVRDFSRRTGISRSYVYVLLSKGELESSKIGGIRLIHEESYLRLLERTRACPKGTRVPAVGEGKDMRT
jgi:excisionase family DNA binding protein